MKKLYLIQDAKTAGDVWTEYAGTREEADLKATITLNHLTDSEKATRCIYVQIYEVPEGFDPATADLDELDDVLGTDEYLVGGYEVFKGDKYHD